jgi:hypothetical protein
MFEPASSETYLKWGDMSAFTARMCPRTQKKIVKMRASIRWAGVLIAICSWIAVTNHCAFAAVVGRGPSSQPASYDRQDTDATQCPFHSKPAKQKQQSSQVQCCKILRAVVVAQSNVRGRDDGKFSDAKFGVDAGVFLVHSLRTVAPLLLDTGPPLHAFSFAELILQQSLPAHAPPFVA